MFLCIHSADRLAFGNGAHEAYRRRLQLVAGEAVTTHTEPGFTAFVAQGRSPLRPLATRRNHLVAIGNVRLENAGEVASWSGVPVSGVSHLALVAAAIEQLGEECVSRLLGDFAFVVWNRVTGEAIAARDALGVRTLFWRATPGVTALASLASLLAHDCDYDLEFMADFLVGGDPLATRTPWRGIASMHGGHALSLREGRQPVLRCFWTPSAFEPAARPGSASDVDGFADLFAAAVRSCTTENTWSELSGGLDSSSVVCLAKHLFAAGRHSSDILGTISIVDELGEGDERYYSDAVVERYGLRNEQVTNYWAWQDDGLAPPLTDRPTMLYPFFARDRRLSTMVRDAGAKVLLSGMGSDHYLWASTQFLADAAARGEVMSCVRGVATWAIAQRQSFWHGLLRDVLKPVVARARWHLRGPSQAVVPTWIPGRFAKELGIAARHWEERKNGFALGERFARETTEGIIDLPAWLLREPYEDGFERRYPFLSRPLVEYCLTLPIELRAHPLEPKVVLREAMRDVLPERIRRRQGKGGIDARIVWSLWHERARITEVLRDPVLAQLGCLQPRPLRAAVEQSWSARKPDYPTLLRALGLETWLCVREGRWATRSTPATESPDPEARHGTSQVQTPIRSAQEDTANALGAGISSNTPGRINAHHGTIKVQSRR